MATWKRTYALIHLGVILLLAIFYVIVPEVRASPPDQTYLSAAQITQFEAKREILFNRMLEAPSDLDVAFEYARISTQLGDFESAVSTLERLLIYAPGLARIQLELGALYYRMGSLDTARSYFNAAISGPDVTSDVIDRVSLYLEQIKKKSETASISGSIFTALRWQSNANSGPTSRSATLNGLEFLLEDESVEKADWSLVTVLSINGDFDLENQGDRIESSLVLYSARYLEQDRVNLELLAATLGPSINLKRWDFNNSKLKLYGIFDWARLDDNYYFSAYGGGFNLMAQPGLSTRLSLRGEYRFKTYNDTPARRFTDGRSGHQSQITLSIGQILSPVLFGNIEVRIQREEAEQNHYSNWELFMGAGATYRFSNPFWQSPSPLALQLGSGIVWRAFDRADLAIDPLETENDRIYWVRSTLLIPLRKDLLLMPQLEYRDHNSNYQTRDFTNFTAMLGVNWRF